MTEVKARVMVETYSHCCETCGKNYPSKWQLNALCSECEREMRESMRLESGEVLNREYR